MTGSFGEQAHTGPALPTDEFATDEFEAHQGHTEPAAIHGHDPIPTLLQTHDPQQARCHHIRIEIRKSDSHGGRIGHRGRGTDHPRDEVPQDRARVPGAMAPVTRFPAQVVNRIEDHGAIESVLRGINFPRGRELRREDDFLPNEHGQHPHLTKHQRARRGRRMIGRCPSSRTAERWPLANLSPNLSILVRG